MATLPLTFVMWLVMTLAMMLPVATPWIIAYGGISRRLAGSGWKHSIALFVAGYVTVWVLFTALAAAGQVSLQVSGVLDDRMLTLGRVPASLLLVVAGLYQWTPLKAACLRHCRNPLTYVLSNWRGGPPAAFGMGFRHGVFCLGCCWLLMSLAFALGVMNLLWMAALTAVISLEQLGPKLFARGRFVGVALVVWGLSLLWI